MVSTASKASAVAGAAGSRESAERMRRVMEAAFFVSLKGSRMSHERDASFHLGARLIPLAWGSSIGMGLLLVAAWLLPRQYSATALILAAAVAVALATALG